MKDEVKDIRMTSYSVVPYFYEVNKEILIEIINNLNIENLIYNKKLFENTNQIFELILKSKEISLDEKNKLIIIFYVNFIKGNDIFRELGS